MFLEHWIHDRIGAGLSIEDYQLVRLREALDYVYKKSAFYGDSFDKHEVKPDDICCLDDLPLLPFVRAQDLREKPHKFLCISLSKVKRVFTLYTGGTSGTPKMVFFSQKDLDRIADYMGAAVKSAAESGGIYQKDFRVYIILPNGKPESQQKMLARGLREVGAVPILGDLSLSTEEQIKCIKESKPDILFATPSRINRITQETKETHDLSKFGVKILFLTSEYVPSVIRERMQEIWKAEVFTHYGMTEMGWAGGIECQAHAGLHFNEMDFLLEVVDPATGVVLKNSEEGELVLTTLNREAMPLIRYRTGDLTRLLKGDDECGASHLRRIGTPIKKIDSLVKIGNGQEICPAMFDDALYSMPNIIDYQSLLLKEGDKERLALKVEVTGIWGKAQEEIAKAVFDIPLIRENIEAGSMKEPEIEIVAQGMLKRKGRSKKLIVDKRQ